MRPSKPKRLTPSRLMRAYLDKRTSLAELATIMSAAILLGGAHTSFTD